MFVVANLVVDVLYAWLDPRIRYSMTVAARTPAAAAAAGEPTSCPTPTARRSRRPPVRPPPAARHVGLVIVLVMFAAGAFAGWIAPYDPEANDFAAMM